MRSEAERVRCELTAALESARGEGGSALYDSAATATAVQSLATSLSEGSLSEGGLAFVVARVLDDCCWAGFTHDWIKDRGSRFALREGERYPVGEMRLMGAVGYSSRPHHLNLPDGELPHVRRHSADNIKVEVRGEYAAILDGLVGKAPLSVAAALINETLDELRPQNPAAPAVDNGTQDGSVALPNWVGPRDPVEQTARVMDLLRQAREHGVAVAVLPELCVTADMIAQLAEEWARQMDAPVLFASSVDMRDAGQRINRTSVLLPGVGVAWTHDKYAPFEARDGMTEPIDHKRPRIVLGCGDVVRVATVICKDAFSPVAAKALGDLGVHLLAIPAMSAKLGPFSAAAEGLINRSQGATLVANNPRVWDDGPVEHARLWHPVPGTQRSAGRSSDAAPELGIARLGSGWDPRTASVR